MFLIFKGVQPEIRGTTPEIRGTSSPPARMNTGPFRYPYTPAREKLPARNHQALDQLALVFRSLRRLPAGSRSQPMAATWPIPLRPLGASFRFFGVAVGQASRLHERITALRAGWAKEQPLAALRSLC